MSGQLQKIVRTELDRLAGQVTVLPESAVVVGLGRTGLSVARFLESHGVHVTVVDSRNEPPCLIELQERVPGADICVGGFDKALFCTAKLLVVSPGVSLNEPEIIEAIKFGVPVIGDVELFARYVKAPVMAITGSNGKSSVTTLVGEMFRCAGRRVMLGGNIGTPVLDLFEEDKPDCYILELSSFQLETTFSLNPVAAVVLNVSPDHMDRYDDENDYFAAKQRIYRGDGVAVINVDESFESRFQQRISPERRQIRFGIEPYSMGDEDFGVGEYRQRLWVMKGAEYLLPVAELPLQGKHNLANTLAALALGSAFKLPMPAMLEALCNFRGLPHRTQRIAKSEGIAWVNDSKGTNVGATIAAIESMPGKVVLIAGGVAKDADFLLLRGVVSDKVRGVILIGKDAALIGEALTGSTVIEYSSSLEQAVTKARQIAKKGDTVLFSPACASFDMFSGYAERGECFIAAVENLLKVDSGGVT